MFTKWIYCCGSFHPKRIYIVDTANVGPSFEQIIQCDSDSDSDYYLPKSSGHSLPSPYHAREEMSYDGIRDFVVICYVVRNVMFRNKV